MPFAPEKPCSHSIGIIAGQPRRLIGRMKTLPVQRCTKRAMMRGKEEAIVMGWMCPPAMAIGMSTNGANAAALPILLGAKQDQDVYLVGQLQPSILQQPCTEQRS